MNTGTNCTSFRTAVANLDTKIQALKNASATRNASETTLIDQIAKDSASLVAVISDNRMDDGRGGLRTDQAGVRHVGPEPHVPGTSSKVTTTTVEERV